MALDITVILAYIAGINIVGFLSSRASTLNEYFLSGRRLPWPVACLSIVATETSSLTFISIPGLAYVSNLGFLQVALGYCVGRVLVAYILLPRYFEGKIETAYEFLQGHFGLSSRRFVSIIFHVTRLLADAIRLFATAIPLSFLLGFEGYWQSILIISVATFAYTLYGGIRSVAVTDAIQMFLYLVSATAVLVLIPHMMGISISEVFSRIPPDRYKIFSSGFNGGWEGVWTTYNVFSGLIGGAFLSFASHGTDHLMVQRALSCRDLAAARKAMIGSGIIVFLQFALFLLVGLFIFALMGGKAYAKPDDIMPDFIVSCVPAGLKGLMLAGLFAAAMSTISASINSISSSTVLDIFMLGKSDMPEKRKVAASRMIAFAWTGVMMGVALLLRNNRSPLVELGLGIASITYGGMLGIFMQAILFRRVSEPASIAGVAVSIAVLLAVSFFTRLFWPWYVPIGFAVSFSIGALCKGLFGDNITTQRRLE